MTDEAFNVPAALAGQDRHDAFVRLAELDLAACVSALERDPAWAKVFRASDGRTAAMVAIAWHATSGTSSELVARLIRASDLEARSAEVRVLRVALILLLFIFTRLWQKYSFYLSLSPTHKHTHNYSLTLSHTHN